MSIAALPADVAGRYGELAVFPEDTSIPITTISRLWAHSGHLSPQRSRALLADLARKLLSLIQGGRQETIRFHDLQQDFLKLEADDLPALHARLLDAYRPATGPGPICRRGSHTCGPGSAIISAKRDGRKS